MSSFCSIPCQGRGQLGFVLRLLPRVCEGSPWPLCHPASRRLEARTLGGSFYRTIPAGLQRYRSCSQQFESLLIFFQVQSNACPFFCLTFWASKFCWGMCLPSLPEKHFKMNKTWTGAIQPSQRVLSSLWRVFCFLLPLTDPMALLSC